MARRKAMRLPNGFGSIVELKGRRRKPFAAMSPTLGYTDSGAPIRKYIAYCETRAEAYEVLVMYNKNPYDIDLHNLTFAELYEKFINKKQYSPSYKSQKGTYKMGYSVMQPFHNIKVIDIKSFHLQDLLDERSDDYAHDSLVKVRSVWKQMYDLALEYEIVSKNWADFVEIRKLEDVKHCESFTPEELDVLWKNLDMIPNVDMVLTMCYTGFRIGEYKGLKFDDNEKIMIGGFKTEAGKDRTVPVAPKIANVLERVRKNNNLFGRQPDAIRKDFYNALEMCGIDAEIHRPHDTRATFTSLLEHKDVKDVIIDKLIGHKSKNLTKDVYTSIFLDDLREAVARL